MKILFYLLTVTISLTALFDPSELAIGNHFIVLPNTILSVFEVLGNTLWLMGIVYLFLGTCALIPTIVSAKSNDNHATLRRIMNETIDGLKKRPLKLRRRVDFVVHGINTTLLIGSGFLFTGIALLYAMLATKTLTRVFWEEIDIRFPAVGIVPGNKDNKYQEHSVIEGDFIDHND